MLFIRLLNRDGVYDYMSICLCISACVWRRNEIWPRLFIYSKRFL